jgi:hypothetical protein
MANPAAELARMRWAKASKRDRSEHGRLMARARWGSRCPVCRKRGHLDSRGVCSVECGRVTRATE